MGKEEKDTVIAQNNYMILSSVFWTQGERKADIILHHTWLLQHQKEVLS